MSINFRAAIGVSAIMLVLFSPIVSADSPKNIAQPDRHSVEVKGKIHLYRVQVEGMNLGEGENKVNAEVFVTLDSKPDMVYSLQLHKDSPMSNQVMADTLRDAYINKIPVTLYYQIAPKQDNNLKILMVQLD